MRILIDTNVLVSALAFHSDRILKAVIWCHEHRQCFITDQNASALIRVTMAKKPQQLPLVSDYIRHPHLQWVYTTNASMESIADIRDPKDQPILNAAIFADVDIILTGDKDFTSFDIERPRIMTPAQFLAEFVPD